jgi:hypothetical protein
MVTKTSITEIINGITVKYPSGENDAPLYCRYDGECSAQPASIDFYPSRRLFTADFNADIGGAMSMDVFHGTCIEFPVDPLVERSHLEWMMRRLAEKFLPELLDEYSEEWDGSNDKGILTEDGEYFKDSIESWVLNSSERHLADDPDEENEDDDDFDDDDD